jgi:hypothetical protein
MIYVAYDPWVCDSTYPFAIRPLKGGKAIGILSPISPIPRGNPPAAKF